MGGLGSGRHSGWGRAKVETVPSLDVNELHQAGYLRSGWRGIRQWTRNGQTIAGVGMRADRDQLLLDYRFRANGSEWENVVQTVHLVHVPCRCGGERPFFICPGVLGGTPCGRRAGKLYSAGRHFLCRHCSRLTYASQCEDTGTRLRRKARKALRHLDGDTSDWISVQRPKGMWHRTFDRLQRRSFELEMQADELFDGRLARIRSR
jgi:hypothetical protein